MVVNYIHQIKRISNILKNAAPTESMGPSQLCGIIFLLTAIGGTSLVCIPIFLEQLADKQKDRAIEIYKGSLALIFDDKQICKWLWENVKYFTAELGLLLSHLKTTPSEIAYEVLQTSRIC